MTRSRRLAHQSSSTQIALVLRSRITAPSSAFPSGLPPVDGTPGIALDCFGIGWEGYNDDLLENLSRNGDGRYGFVNTPEAAATEFAGQLAGALHVAASDVKVQVEFNPRRVTTYRQIGYAKHQLTKEQFRDNTVDAAEIGAAESGNALYVIESNAA